MTLTATRLTLFSLATAISLTLASCVSSEETGGTGRTGNPQPVITRIDTTRRTAVRAVPAQIDSAKPKLIAELSKPHKPAKITPTLKSKRDTLQASLSTRQRSKASSSAPEPVPSDVYTIQVGAFRNAAFAMRAQQKAKQRFPGVATISRFDAVKNLYRISIGQFEKHSQARAFKETLVKRFPKEYGQCWLRYIR